MSSKNKIKYPKYLRLKPQSNCLSEKEIEFIRNYSNDFEMEVNSISIQDLRISLLSLGMEEKSPSFLKIINDLSTPEYLENAVPFDILQEIVEENLGINDDRSSVRKIFESSKSDPDQEYLTLNDIKKLMNNINIEFEEEELKNMLKECSQTGKDIITYEDFCLLMLNKIK